MERIMNVWETQTGIVFMERQIAVLEKIYEEQKKANELTEKLLQQEKILTRNLRDVSQKLKWV